MANKDFVAYSHSLQRNNDVKGIEYASCKSREDRKTEGFKIGYEIGYKIGYKIGYEIGFKIGLEKGKTEEMARSIRMMEGFGIPLDKIAEQYGLSVEKIKELLS